MSCSPKYIYDRQTETCVSRKGDRGLDIVNAHKKHHPENAHISLGFLIAHRKLKLLHEGTLTVAAYPNFFPVSFREKGTIRGLDADIMKLFAKEAGLAIKFVIVEQFDGIWNYPAKGLADVAIGGIANLESRTRKQTEWTVPYFQVDRSVLFRKDRPIKQFPQDISNVPVIGTQGSTGFLDAQARLKSIHKEGLLKRGTSDEEDLSMLETGQVQGLLRGSFVSRAIVKDHPDLDLTTWEALEKLMPSDGEVFCQPCKLGSGLAVLLSTFIAELVGSGGLRHLMEKWNLR